MKTNKHILLSFVLLFATAEVKSQEDWGGRIGINLQFGSHIQRVGLMYQIYYFKNHVQISNGLYAHFNIKSLGPKGSYPELKIQIGFQGQWQSTDREKYHFNESSNMSPFLNSLGYSFYVYADCMGMSQTTGAIQGTIDRFTFAIDNDALGLNQIDDMYRTGGFYLGYQIDSTLIGIQNTLWTGKSSDAPRVEDPNYPSRFGYRDVTKSKYGDESHGILAMRIETKWEYDQILRGEVGIDAERVRHIVQNKLIHDGISGRLVSSKSPHYPMLQKDASLFLFKENQEVRKVRPYLQLGINQAQFY